MLEFGILVDSLGKDQKSQSIITELNKGVKNNEICPIMFFLECDIPIITPLFARMQAEEVYCYPHPVISTSMKTAEILLDIPLPIKKYLYLWDMEWLYKIDDFEKYKNIMDNLDVIVRCKEHQQLIQQCWLKTSHIVEDFCYDRLKKLLSE